ncbi:MAG TPA: VOC family protein [Gemmatimonadaceae bacterium]|nr:VOC family protein [Gemmatimonadaceae bacterium]
MSIDGVAPLRGRIVPHLVVRDVEQAVHFYQRALGARELYRSRMPFTNGLHVQLRVSDNIVMVSARRMSEFVARTSAR